MDDPGVTATRFLDLGKVLVLPYAGQFDPLVPPTREPEPTATGGGAPRRRP